VKKLIWNEFTNTSTINRRPVEVFRFLAHFPNVPRWNYAISQTRQIADGPVGVGSHHRQTRTLPTRSCDSSIFITPPAPSHDTHPLLPQGAGNAQ
jgi:hypothetical protein